MIKKPLPYCKAICYSGYRDGQSPEGKIPSYEEVKQDLLILQETGSHCDSMPAMPIPRLFSP